MMKATACGNMVCALLAALLSGCYYGGVDRPLLADDVPHTFLSLDADLDGTVSRAEAGAAPLLASHFERADANRDGVLDRYEFNSAGWRPFPREPE